MEHQRDADLYLEMYLGDRVMQPVFVSRHGLRLSARQAQRRLAIWLERAGCRPASPHALRHTFATGLYHTTGDIFLVQQALAHRSIESTLIYARADPERLRNLLQDPSRTVA